LFKASSPRLNLSILTKSLNGTDNPVNYLRFNILGVDSSFLGAKYFIYLNIILYSFKKSLFGFILKASFKRLDIASR
jgi:hypothetical protein